MKRTPIAVTICTWPLVVAGVAFSACGGGVLGTAPDDAATCEGASCDASMQTDSATTVPPDDATSEALPNDFDVTLTDRGEPPCTVAFSGAFMGQYSCFVTAQYFSASMLTIFNLTVSMPMPLGEIQVNLLHRGMPGSATWTSGETGESGTIVVQGSPSANTPEWSLTASPPAMGTDAGNGPSSGDAGLEASSGDAGASGGDAGNANAGGDAGGGGLGDGAVAEAGPGGDAGVTTQQGSYVLTIVEGQSMAMPAGLNIGATGTLSASLPPVPTTGAAGTLKMSATF